jgi:hypothetical protein
MMLAEFDVREWDFLPPLDEASLPDEPPVELVLVEWPEPPAPVLVFADPADHTMEPDDAVRSGLAWRQPGVAELARLACLDFHALTRAQRIEAVADQQRQQAWLAARQISLLSLVSAHDSTDKHWCIEEIGCALGLSGPAAQNLLKNAEQLCGQLPATFTALSEGRIGLAAATVITEASYHLPDEVLPDYEHRVLRHAHQQSTVQVKRSAKRAALQLDPATAEAKHQRSVADRHIRIVPAEHGTAWLMALLPAAQAQLLYDRIDGDARATQATDPRTMDQLRADALVNAVLAGTTDDLPTTQGHRPAINVVVALSTLVGRDEEPGWLDGYGPIPAGYARQLAFDPTGTWRRLITDPVTGQLLNYGTTRYRPPRHLSDHVINRDGECTFPFCTHRARRSDLDHITAYPAGSTSAGNLQPLHRRHHNAKTEAGWQARRDTATGAIRWISPTGRHHISRPPDRWTTPEPVSPIPTPAQPRHHPAHRRAPRPHPSSRPPATAIPGIRNPGDARHARSEAAGRHLAQQQLQLVQLAGRYHLGQVDPAQRVHRAYALHWADQPQRDQQRRPGSTRQPDPAQFPAQIAAGAGHQRGDPGLQRPELVPTGQPALHRAEQRADREDQQREQAHQDGQHLEAAQPAQRGQDQHRHTGPLHRVDDRAAQGTGQQVAPQSCLGSRRSRTEVAHLDHRLLAENRSLRRRATISPEPARHDLFIHAWETTSRPAEFPPWANQPAERQRAGVLGAGWPLTAFGPSSAFRSPINA